MQFLFKNWLLAVLVLLGFLCATHTVSASDVGIAQSIQLEEAAPSGSLIGNSQSRYQLTQEPYDKTMVGVVTTTPAIELKSLTNPDETTYSLVSDGQVAVRVNGENGPIAEGDSITASSMPGVGMKATKTGFILGYAKSAVDPGDGEVLVSVALDIKFAFAEDSPLSERIGTNLLEAVKLSTNGAVQNPLTALRYMLASLIMVTALAVTFFTVARVARHGVDAIGRNPLATKAITFGIVLNIVLSIGVLAVGAYAAYTITTL